MKYQKLTPNNADLELWQELTSDITKLPDANRDLSEPEFLEVEIRPTVNLSQAYSGNTLKEITIGTYADIDRRTAERFRHGEFKIERRLDLHGYTENNAYKTVKEFIKSSYLQNCHCVQIITGKGIRRETDDIFENKGILKDKVPQWLNNYDIRPLILAFDYSAPADGGEGALSIFLRAAKTKK